MPAKKPPSPGAPLSYNPFAGLGTPDDTSPPSQAPTRQPALDPSPTEPRRAVVRFQRKGHGGKDVTLVEKLALPPGELEHWLRELKAALGCGGVVDGETLLLQGDHRSRLPALLSRRGVGKITVS